MQSGDGADTADTEENAEDGEDATESASQAKPMPMNKNSMMLVFGAIALIGVGGAGFFIMKKKNGGGNSKSAISNSFNQVAHRVNKGGKLFDEDIADMKERLEKVWRLLVSIRSTREHTVQLLISATQTKPQTANMLLATCAYLLHLEHQNSLETSGIQSAQDEAEANAST